MSAPGRFARRFTRSALEGGDHVFDFRWFDVEVHARGVETQTFDARVSAVTALPQALACAADARAFFAADAAEAARPRAVASRADFDDAHDGAVSRDDVDLERTETQVPRDDVVAAGDEPFGDERFSAFAARLLSGIVPRGQGFKPSSEQFGFSSTLQTLVETGGFVGSKVVPAFTQYEPASCEPFEKPNSLTSSSQL